MALLPRNALYLRSGINPYESINKMLMKNRIQFLLEYPLEIAHFEKNFAITKPLTSLELEDAASYIEGHFVCSRSRIGKKVIAQANAHLKMLYTNSHYLEAHLRYMPQSDRQGFIQHIQRITQINEH